MFGILGVYGTGIHWRTLFVISVGLRGMSLRKTKTINETKQVVIVTCDFCDEESKGTYTRIKQCFICRKDVCWECSEHIDWECSLLKPYFDSDYPRYVCKSCWNSGEEIRQKIMIVRDTADEAESDLLDKWESLCRVERNSTKTQDS